MSHTIIDAVMIHYAVHINDRYYHLFYGVDDAWKEIQELVSSMREHGWKGTPAVVLMNDIVVVGNKRMVAAMLAGVQPEMHEISIVNPDGSKEIDDLAWALLEDACDTDEMLQYARALQQHGAIDDYSVRLLEQEVAKESRAR